MRFKIAVCFLFVARLCFGQGSGNAVYLQGRYFSSVAPSNGNVICYDSSATRWKPCAAGGGSVAFSSVTAGTNAAALVIGTGGSFTTSGSGTINATSLGGNLAATYAPLASPTFTGTVTIGTTVPTGGVANSLAALGSVYAAKGTLRESVIATDAYYLSGLNTVSVAKNSLATYNGKQYAAYIATNLHIKIIVRVLSTGVLTAYDTGITVADSDEHRVVTIALDSAGYIHMAYGMHVSSLLYRKSTNPEDPSAFGSVIAMLGTNESAVTYPMFMKSPVSNELYFTFREGVSNNADQYFYHYTVAGATWSAATGTDTAGRLINGTVTPRSPYLNGLPKWDASGNLWFQWSWNTTGINQYLIKWNGTSFFKFSGAAQTIPATNANLTPVVTIADATNLQIQNDFAISSAGVFYIPYWHDDANSILQAWVAESSTGSFVEHQLTRNTNATTANVIPIPESTSICAGAYCYVMYPDTAGKERGAVAWQSSDGFTTANKFYPIQMFNPNWELSYDPQRLASGVVSFLFEDTDDAVYGQSYLNTATGNTNLGKLSIIDWIPSLDGGTSKGVPADLYGLNVIGGNFLKAVRSSATTLGVGVADTALLTSTADGNLLLTEADGVGFGVLQFGCSDASCPGITKYGSSFTFSAADGTDYVPIESAQQTAHGNVIATSSNSSLLVTLNNTTAGTGKRWDLNNYGPDGHLYVTRANVDQVAFKDSVFGMRSAYVLGFSSTSDPSGTVDAAACRGASGIIYFANTASCAASGKIRPGGYQSSDGTDGVTVSACTSFKNGICVAGT